MEKANRNVQLEGDEFKTVYEAEGKWGHVSVRLHPTIIEAAAAVAVTVKEVLEAIARVRGPRGSGGGS